MRYVLALRRDRHPRGYGPSLKRLGLPVICVDDASCQGGAQDADQQKYDRNDAIGIARIMQTGWFKEVHVKDIDSHSVRALLASRAPAGQDQA